jgi:hypothetical protein
MNREKKIEPPRRQDAKDIPRKEEMPQMKTDEDR